MECEDRGHESRPASSELQERVKELTCLYAVSQIIVGAELDLPDRIRKIVTILPSAWRYPDLAVARITLDQQRFESLGYERVHAVQRADLVVEGRRRGCVEVGYISTPPGDSEVPFLPEERNLIENIAHQLSLCITRQEGATRRAVLEQELRHADRLATIGQLAARAAHEMNEPLCSVLGFAQLALKTPGTPQAVSNDLREIVNASLRARDLVKKLLLFARQTPIERVPMNLNERVEEALFLLEAGSEKQGIRLMRRLAEDLPTIEADPIQIRQVLVNLTVNAMQAIATEGTVTVETRAEPQHVILSVSDTGQGMSPDVLKNIFNPFFTTKEPGEGTGLGLSVVHGIVASHGGTIEVESQVGQGSRFIVRLPAAGNLQVSA